MTREKGTITMGSTVGQKKKLTEIPTCPFVALGEIHPDYKVR
jgi:hypothetical protein